jgi:hypothetical protein
MKSSMAFEKVFWIYAFCAVIVHLHLCEVPSVLAGDIVHDDSTPKKPGCENQFVLVILFTKFASFSLFISGFCFFFFAS